MNKTLKTISFETLSEIIDFLLSGNYCDFDCSLFLPLFEDWNGLLYRGMYFPKEKLFPGTIVVEPLHGCTHWSIHESVARDYATEADNEDWFEEYGEEHGCGSVEETLDKLFTPTIFVINSPKYVFPAYQYIPEAIRQNVDFTQGSGDAQKEMQDQLLKESEVTIVDSDFIIREVSVRDGFTYCLVERAPAGRT